MKRTITLLATVLLAGTIAANAQYSGNPNIASNASWGLITGSLADQSDLNSALGAKATTTSLNAEIARAATAETNENQRAAAVETNIVTLVGTNMISGARIIAGTTLNAPDLSTATNLPASALKPGTDAGAISLATATNLPASSLKAGTALTAISLYSGTNLSPSAVVTALANGPLLQPGGITMTGQVTTAKILTTGAVGTPATVNPGEWTNAPAGMNTNAVAIPWSVGGTNGYIRWFPAS